MKKRHIKHATQETQLTLLKQSNHKLSAKTTTVETETNIMVTDTGKQNVKTRNSRQRIKNISEIIS